MADLDCAISAEADNTLVLGPDGKYYVPPGAAGGDTSTLSDPDANGQYIHSAGGVDKPIDTNAASNPYGPATAASWGATAPDDVAEALDLLIERKSRVEVAPDDNCYSRHVDDSGSETHRWLTEPDSVVYASAAIQGTQIENSSALSDAFGTKLEQIDLARVSVTNPSDCYNMVLEITHHARLRIDRFIDVDGTIPVVNVDNEVLLIQDVTIDGGASWVSRMVVQDANNNVSTAFGFQEPGHTRTVIMPGTSLDIGYRYRILYNGAGTPSFSNVWRRYVVNLGGIDVFGYTVRA